MEEFIWSMARARISTTDAPSVPLSYRAVTCTSVIVFRFHQQRRPITGSGRSLPDDYCLLSCCAVFAGQCHQWPGLRTPGQESGTRIVYDATMAIGRLVRWLISFARIRPGEWASNAPRRCGSSTSSHTHRGVMATAAAGIMIVVGVVTISSM